MSRVNRKVFVGMSGGVDSSVSAGLLQKEGYEVVGVFIKVWQADFLPCTWREERRDAMRACAHLGIPFLTLDLEKEYKAAVVDYMINEYTLGRTPNPDVMCNKHVKFGAFLDFARTHGADLIATGHYAQVIPIQGLPLYGLYAGADKEKDQSYFLWTLTQEQLAHTLFPVGHLQKTEVRELARTFGLPNAEKKDSQGLCFMGPVDMKEFLAHYVHAKKGAILNTSGEVIGEHDGALLYTLGERQGLRIKNKGVDSPAHYVVAKDVAHNTLTVDTSPRREVEQAEALDLEQFHLNSGAGERSPFRATAQFRYHGRPRVVTVTLESDSRAKLYCSDVGEVVAPGQSVVLYDEKRCMGGGVVAS